MNLNLIKKNTFAAFVRNHWLLLLIVLQPVLDILAFWTKNPDATISGYVRLLIMVAFPVWLFIKFEDNKKRVRFAAAMAAIGLVCFLHIFNLLRIGSVSLMYDLQYTAKAAQLPILAVCFMFSINNDQIRNQAYWGLFFAAVISAAALGLSVITNTANITYGEGLGISGWVIDDNRCANSTVVVVLAAFASFCSVKSDKKIVNILVPSLAALILIVNGTMTCYLSIFLINIGFVMFLPLESKIRGCRLNKNAVIVLVVVSIVSALAYPLTPKYKISQSQVESAEEVQVGIVELMNSKGYDIENMSLEEIVANEEVKAAIDYYYRDCMWYKSPDLFERFHIEEIFAEFDMTLDGETLMDTRRLKSAYASLMWNHSDTMTRFFGIDISDLWYNGRVDLENDWPAIYYYYGYLGIASYGAFVLYFVYLILRRLLKNFKTAFTADNFILLITFVLLIGIAQYSGAVLRRPNVSIYLSLIMGLIYYQTVVKSPDKASSWRGEWV